MGRNFGVPLNRVYKTKGHKVPYVLEKLIDYLQENALDSEGLFRVPGAFESVQFLIRELDDGRDVDLTKYGYNEVAEVLKKFFSFLPEPLVPSMIDSHVKALFDGQKKPVEEILPEMKFAVDSLGEDNFAVLERLSKFLSILISHSDRNKMNLHNTVTCFAPTLKFTPAILSYCIQHHNFFFGPQMNTAPEELKTLVTRNSGDKNEKRYSMERRNSAEFSRKPISPINRRSVPNIDHLKKPDSDEKIKEELLMEKAKVKEEFYKEKKIMKEEWSKERQQLKEDLAKEKEFHQEELTKERRRLKLDFSSEKRGLKEEIERLLQELDVWKTIAQARKEKLDSVTEINYELERKLKKQQLKKKAMELDIEMLERKVKQLKAEVGSPKISPRMHHGTRDSELFSTSKSTSKEIFSDNEIEEERERLKEKERNNMRRKHGRARSTSSSASSSLNEKRLSSYTKQSDPAPVESEKGMSSKDKTKDLLKKNTAKLAQDSVKKMSHSLELSPFSSTESIPKD